MNIGIDIGGVILQNAEIGINVEEVEGAIESIKKLSEKHPIFIISKVEKERTRERIIEIFRRIDFYERTGLDSSNIIFVATIEEKAQKAKELNIDIFIDDKFSVLEKMKRFNIYSICINRHYKTLQKGRADKLVRSWKEIVEIIEGLKKG